LIDSLSNGSFQIKNNLFIDNFAMGPDTDAIRQSEFTDTPDNDPVKGYLMTWIVVRKNPTSHITPWVISNNYYAISDSGLAMRTLSSPYLHTPTSTLYPGRGEPIITSDMKRQLAANGGDTTNAFKKVIITPTKAPPLMTKMIRWYNTPVGDGTGGNTVANVGAGAGRLKDGTTNTPASHFIHDVTKNVWVYDYNRQTTAWYMDSLDASYKASVNLSAAATDGKIVGSTLWSFKGVVSGVEATSNQVPERFALNHNYPNPFNPSTTLEYSISRNSHVTLEVFNVLGQSVARPVDEELMAGTYKTTFDASKLSSGIYLYRLKAGDFVQTKKMVLMK
jgi:hypothetical protein